MLNATALEEVARALAGAEAAVERACSGGGESKAAVAVAPPPLLSWSHYPLAMISSSPRASRGAAAGGRALARLLGARGAAAHVSGHMHTLAGDFMYASHEMPPPDSSSRRQPISLPEFELGDWKSKRRWRLLAFDGADATVADFDFDGGRVRSLEPSAVVGSHIVVVTAAAATSDDGLPGVRALVLPRAPGAPAVAAARLAWACGAAPPGKDEGGSGGGSGGAIVASGVADLAPAAGHPSVRAPPAAASSSGRHNASAFAVDAARLYLGSLSTVGAAAGCGSALWVQARVTDAMGEESASAWRRVQRARHGDDAASASAGVLHGGRAHAAGAAGEAALLAPGARATFLIGARDWAARLRALQVAGAAAHLVGLVLLPRLAGGALLSAHARLAYPLPAGRSPSLLQLVAGAGAGGAVGGAAGSGAGPPGRVRSFGAGGGPGGARAPALPRLLFAVTAWAGALVARGARLPLLLALWPFKVCALPLLLLSPRCCCVGMRCNCILDARLSTPSLFCPPFSLPLINARSWPSAGRASAAAAASGRWPRSARRC